MPVHIPTPDDVQKLFVDAIKATFPAATEMSADEFEAQWRSTGGNNWQHVSPDVEVLQVGTRARLLRVSASLSLDDHAQGQEWEFRTRLADITSALRTIAQPNSRVELDFKFAKPSRVGPVQILSCRANGIVWQD